MGSIKHLDKVLDSLVKSGKKEKGPSKDEYLPTVSTLLNLALTGHTQRGYRKGRYYFYVGDTASGKTFIALGALAMAAINKNFKKYRLIFDNNEEGAEMDMERYFGRNLVKRLVKIASQTLEEFYYTVYENLKKGPCIYILDSITGLNTKEEDAQFEERKAAHHKGTKTKGTFGVSGAKVNSNYLRKIPQLLKKTGSILIIISQTRSTIGPGSIFNPKTRGGGAALSFYATCEIWTAVRGVMKRKVRGTDRKIGMWASIHVTKNRQTGQDHTVKVPFNFNVGVDDMGSCVHFLIKEKHWKGGKKGVKAPEFDYKGSIENLIRQIEAKDQEPKLRRIVKEVWMDIIEKCKVERKSPYR